jgi:hypothetical protein
MKYLCLLALFLTIYSVQAKAYSCDEIHDSGELRSGGYKYLFGLAYNNEDMYKHKILKVTMLTDETESGDLNRDGAKPINFHFSPELKSQNGEVMPHQTIKNAIEADEYYTVFDYPSSRDKKFRVVYQFETKAQNSDGSWSTILSKHTSCQEFIITSK